MVKIQGRREILQKLLQDGEVSEELLDLLGIGLLSDKEIMEQKGKGNIIIHPFNQEDLGTSSYDLRLGRYFFVEKALEGNRMRIFNPYNEKHVQRVWGEKALTGVRREDLTDRGVLLRHLQSRAEQRHFRQQDIVVESLEEDLLTFRPDEEIFFLFPEETVLAHTDAFVGYRKYGTTMMKARSSIGRSFLEVCKCAGMGDAGYFNRWTMEITNNSKHHILPLVVGRRFAQLAFFHIGETLGEYNRGGKYQQTPNLDDLMNSWNPSMMLPRLYADRDAKNSASILINKDF